MCESWRSNLAKKRHKQVPNIHLSPVVFLTSKWFINHQTPLKVNGICHVEVSSVFFLFEWKVIGFIQQHHQTATLTMLTFREQHQKALHQPSYQVFTQKVEFRALIHSGIWCNYSTYIQDVVWKGLWSWYDIAD